VNRKTPFALLQVLLLLLIVVLVLAGRSIWSDLVWALLEVRG
jgi:hypothetical protein